MFEHIYQKITEFSTIIIHRHNKPDGDALGSQIGLKEAILATFPSKKVYVVGDMIERYQWIGSMDEITDEKYTDALVFVLDSGSEKLISDERYRTGKYLIKIDHHLPQGTYGDYAHVDPSFESCAGIIAQMILKTPLQLNQKAATALFTGIVTDSGRFRYQATTQTTFAIASALMQYQIDTESIYQQLYTEKLATIKLKALLTTKFEVTPSGVAYLINTQEEVARYGISVFEISRGMVNIMSGIAGVVIWVNFTEDIDGTIYVEFRSSGKNVNQIAVKHGGGGHLQASGCSIVRMDEVYQIIEELNVVAKE